MRCPCSKCGNIKFLKSDETHLHLLKYGFMADYYYWINHGECKPQDQQGPTSDNVQPAVPRMHNTYKNMTQELGRIPTIANTFTRVHFISDTTTGQRVWINDLAKKTHETRTQRTNEISSQNSIVESNEDELNSRQSNEDELNSRLIEVQETHTEKMAALSSQSSNAEEGATTHPMPTELEVWPEVLGGPNKGRLSGLGSQGSYYSGSSCTSRYDAHTWQAEKKELLSEITDLRRNIATQQEDIARQEEDIARQQDELEFLKSQFAMFQQQMAGFLAPPSRPPVSSPQYTSHNQRRLTRFLPTPVGAASSVAAAAAPSPPPALHIEDFADEDGEEDADS